MSDKSLLGQQILILTCNSTRRHKVVVRAQKSTNIRGAHTKMNVNILIFAGQTLNSIGRECVCYGEVQAEGAGVGDDGVRQGTGRKLYKDVVELAVLFNPMEPLCKRLSKLLSLRPIWRGGDKGASTSSLALSPIGLCGVNSSGSSGLHE